MDLRARIEEFIDNNCKFKIEGKGGYYDNSDL